MYLAVFTTDRFAQCLCFLPGAMPLFSTRRNAYVFDQAQCMSFRPGCIAIKRIAPLHRPAWEDLYMSALTYAHVVSYRVQQFPTSGTVEHFLISFMVSVKRGEDDYKLPPVFSTRRNANFSNECN